MATYFLADIHLAENRPEITAAFLATLAALARDADAIYLLGDLYDYWLGDDLATPYQQRIAAALAALPCPLYYQHGNRDFLCSDDRGYQRLRRVLRCRLLQWLYYRLPRALRLRIAEKLRAQSKTRTPRKAARITDTNPAAIRAALQNARASILIHGHTHRPAVHRLDDGDTVYVLGDWRPHGEILRYADGACTLINSAEIIHALDNAGA